MRLLPDSISTPIGILIVVAAIALFVSAVRTLLQAHTPVPGNRPTTAIVRTGPYRFSRNPIYLAFTLLQAGLAAWVNGLAVLLALLPALGLMAIDDDQRCSVVVVKDGMPARIVMEHCTQIVPRP